MTPLCGARCPLIWELGGICQCIEAAGHVERQDGTFGADHLCSCGTWFSEEVARSA